MDQIIECVPNISEGRDAEKIRQIADAVRSVEGVKLLHVDIGKAVNRTVITFAGEPAQVVEAAFRLIRETTELLDMRYQTGVHPRFGATDVCPLVPVKGISMEETVEWARELSKRVGAKLQIPVYCYEYAAFKEERRNLATCREGGYEGLQKRMADPFWRPDFGPAVFHEKFGAVAIGARKFLIAYNINLDTSSIAVAKDIASEIRESGKGKIKGLLPALKAIGWYIEEYQKAQVSMNLTDLDVTPLYRVFEVVKQKALERECKVTGSEIIGLVPLKALVEVAQQCVSDPSVVQNNEDAVKIAVEYLGLNELHAFNPRDKIVEWALEKDPGKENESW